jgi:hypothetical protein
MGVPDMSDFRFGSYGFFYFTAFFFLLSLSGHAVFEWLAYINDQADHGAVASTNGFLVIFLRDTLENWQSEFLQLIWQVAGLSFLLHVGSPQSKEGDDRKEAKLDAILRAVDSKNAPKIISDLDKKFARK